MRLSLVSEAFRDADAAELLERLQQAGRLLRRGRPGRLLQPLPQLDAFRLLEPRDEQPVERR